MKYKLPIIISLCVLAVAFVIKYNEFPFIQHFQLQVFDYYIKQHPREYTPQPVKIIDIDEESLNRLGQWPWPRTKLAEMVEKLQGAGVAAIAWDVVFAEEDRTTPKHMLRYWDKQEQLRDVIATLPDHDAVFAKALSEGNSITSFVFLNKGKNTPKTKAGFSFAGEDPRQFLRNFSAATTTIPLLENSAVGNGALNSFPDNDGIIRRMPLIAVIGEKFYPTLSAEALRVAQGASGYIVKSVGASGEEGFGAKTGITDLKIGAFEIPTDAGGNFWIYYTPYVAERYIPAWKVFEPDFDTAQVEGHILLVGTSAAGLKDIRTTPMSPSTNGVEVHAQAIEQVLTGEYLRRPDWMVGVEIIAMSVIGLVLIVMMIWLPALWGALFTAIVLGLALGGSWYAFLHHRLLIEPITPGIAILLLYLTGSLTKYMAEEQKKKYIKQAFSQYMSPELVNQLSTNPDKLKLGGEMKDLTLLFCDIRGFTSISETMNAEELTVFINHFLTPMTDVILSQQGTIDKYMGDCIMAFWNAPLDDPDHPQHAAQAALDMLQTLSQLNKKLALENHDNPTAIGIGINSGECCVGNMGSDQRFDYTVLGDNVNLASRLEGQSKTYGVDIVIGEATEQYLSDFATLELDLIRVKGKQQAVKIYALLGNRALKENKDFDAFCQCFHTMLTQYRTQAWEEALATLDQAITLSKTLENVDTATLLELYSERIHAYQSSPPTKDWDGVYVASSK